MKTFSSAVVAISVLLFSSSAMSQSFSVSEQEVIVGASSVTVDWTFEAGGNASGVGVDIAFDSSILTPETTTLPEGEAVVGCLDDVENVNLTGCFLTNPSTIRVTLNNFSGSLPNASGQIEFAIATGVAGGDSTQLGLTAASVVPSGTTIDLNDGKIDFIVLAPELKVSPASLTFPATVTGASSSLSLAVENDGDDVGMTVDTPVVGGDHGSDFAFETTCGTATLGQGESCSIDVTFTPTALGARSATLTIASSGGTEVVPLSGQASAGPAQASFSPASGSTIALGNVQIGEQSANSTVEVCNSGAAGSQLTGVTTNVSATGFIMFGSSSACTNGLGQGECCNVTVNATPTAGGETTFTGSLTVNTSAGNASYTVTVVGIDGPEARVSVSPTSLDFEGVDIDATETLTLTVTNDGDADSKAVFTDSPITISGSAFSFASGTTCPVSPAVSGATPVTGLDAGESCSVVVSFKPDAAGSYSGAVSISAFDDINKKALGTLTVALSGEGNGPIFSSDVAVGRSLSEVADADGAASFPFTFSNSGNEALTGTCSLDGDEEFSFVPSSFGSFSVAAGASTSFAVACALEDFETYSATLSCSTNDPEVEEATWELQCVGRPPLPVPTMSVWSLSLMALMLMLMAGFGMRTMRARR